MKDDESLHAPFDPVRDNLLSLQSSDWDLLDAQLSWAEGEQAKGLRSLIKEVREGLDKPVPHKPLPVPGYTVQNDPAIKRVGDNKLAEERILRMIESYERDGDTDRRWLALAKTNLEVAMMCLNRAIFKPQRIKLPEDV